MRAQYQQLIDSFNHSKLAKKRDAIASKLELLMELLDTLGWLIATEHPNQANTYQLFGESANVLGKNQIDGGDLKRILKSIPSANFLHRSVELKIWRDTLDQQQTENPIDDRLSKREMQVFNFLVQGEKAAEIAEALGISPRTVEKHTQRIYEKLGVKTRAQLLLGFSNSRSS